jgi:predicted DNA-binding ribbon-helix-helix protein
VKSTVIERSVVAVRRKTSIGLEEKFWERLKDIARADRTTVSALLVTIRRCQQGNLSSAVRVFVADYCRAKVSAASADRSEPFELISALISHEAQAL